MIQSFFDMESPPMWRHLVRLLRMIEEEQVPVVAGLRERAKASGDVWDHWCVVSYRKWVAVGPSSQTQA